MCPFSCLCTAEKLSVFWMAGDKCLVVFPVSNSSSLTWISGSFSEILTCLVKDEGEESEWARQGRNLVQWNRLKVDQLNKLINTINSPCKAKWLLPISLKLELLHYCTVISWNIRSGMSLKLCRNLRNASGKNIFAFSKGAVGGACCRAVLKFSCLKWVTLVSDEIIGQIFLIVILGLELHLWSLRSRDMLTSG